MCRMSARRIAESVVEIDVSDASRAEDRRVRIGAVSFLNTLPLIEGLDTLRDVEVRLSVPSLLLDALARGDCDIALCSSIDYQRSEADLVMIPAGALACAGPTLTVRLYSTRPIESIEEVKRGKKWRIIARIPGRMRCC
jgi:DNA-binding transcriptional LysR family regulator